MFSTGIIGSKTQWAVVAAAVLFALPAAFAAPYPGSGGSSSGAYLGVHINDLTPEQAAGYKLSDSSGVIVMSIDHDGPACKAGIKADDIIMSVNGTRISNIQQMVDVMQTLSAGSVATIGIVRDGHPKDVKVTLTGRHNWATPHSYPVPNAAAAKSFVAPLPPVSFPADTDVPLVTPASARRGIVVEAITAQLAEYFGVPAGQGLLVRYVQRGSLGASAGLKAGDVIIKIDGRPIRDLADWRGSMHTNSLKTTFSIIRDRHEQTVDMVLPGPSGELRLGDDWDSFDWDMHAFTQPMPKLGPEIRRQTEQAMLLRSDDLANLQRDIERSMQQVQPQIQQQTVEIQKQMEQMRPEIEKQAQAARRQMERARPEIEKQTQEIQQSMALLKQQDLAKMRQQVNQSLQNLTPQIQQQMQAITPQIQAQMQAITPQIQAQMQAITPQIQAQMQAITPQIQEQMQAITPQIQQQLRRQIQQLQKEMQQHQQNMQQMLKAWPNSPDQPTQM